MKRVVLLVAAFVCVMQVPVFLFVSLEQDWVEVEPRPRRHWVDDERRRDPLPLPFDDSIFWHKSANALERPVGTGNSSSLTVLDEFVPLHVPMPTLDRLRRAVGLSKTERVGAGDWRVDNRGKAVLRNLHDDDHVHVLNFETFGGGGDDDATMRPPNECRTLALVQFDDVAVNRCATISTRESVLFFPDAQPAQEGPDVWGACAAAGWTYAYRAKPRTRQEAAQDLGIPMMPWKVLDGNGVLLTHLPPSIYLIHRWGNSYQHFLQDVLPRLVSVWDLFHANPSLHLFLQLKYPIGSEKLVFDLLHIPRHRIVTLEGRPDADDSEFGDVARFAYHTPQLLVPMCLPGPMEAGRYPSELYIRGRQLLFRGRPLPERNPTGGAVIYCSRGSRPMNGGRTFGNEREIVTQLGELLRLRGRELILFDGDETSVEGTMDTFSRASLVFGPHGGALYNVIFAPFGTAVLELCPDDGGAEEIIAPFITKLKMRYHGAVLEGMHFNEPFGDIPLPWLLETIDFLLREQQNDQPSRDLPRLPDGWRPALVGY